MEELKIRAGVDSSAVTSGTRDIIRSFQGVAREVQQIAQQTQNVSLLPANAVRQAQRTAREMIDALEAEFNANIATLQAGQLRGFITPEDAAAAGRQIGDNYRRGLVTALNQASDTAGRQAIIAQIRQLDQVLAGSVKQMGRVAPAARQAGVGLNALRGPLTTLASQAAGTNPAMSQLVSIVGSLALGTGIMVGALAGLAALAFAWNKITEEAREAKKEQREALATAQRLVDAQAAALLGAAGSTILLDRKLVALNETLEKQIGFWGRIKEASDLAAAGGASVQSALVSGLIGWLKLAPAVEESLDVAQGRVANWLEGQRLLTEESKRLAEEGKRIAEQFERAADAAQDLRSTVRQAAVTADSGVADTRPVPLDLSATIRASDELRERIAGISEAIDTIREAGAGVPAGVLALLARLEGALAVSEVEIERRIDAIQEQFERLGTVQIAPQIAIPSIKIPAIVDPFSMAALERSLERTTTGITERLARGLIDPGDFEEQGRIAGAAFNAGILDLIARLRASGALTEALEIELVGKLIIDAGVGDVDTSGFDKTVQAVQQVTSGFEAMANALGDTSTELSAALRAIDSFTSGLALLKQAQTQAGATAALTQASGVLAIGAAVFGVAKAILEGADAARRAQKEFARSMEDWERMLNGISLVDQAFIDARSQFEERTGLRNVPGSNAEEFNRFMQEWMATFGKNLPPETFEKISKAMELFNLDLQRSVDAIRLFANSLAGAAQQRDLENKLRGVELDPTQQISGLLNDLLGTFPDLFKKIFADLNPADLDISDLPEIRQAALDFFESIKGLTGAPLEAILGDASIDDFLGWLGTLADGLNTLDSAVRDTATSLLGVPEVFNFTLASLRAAGTREFLPQSGGPSRFGPDRDPRTPSQDNRTTVAAGAVQITVAQDGDELLDKIADVVAVGLERAAKLGGKTLTASEIRQMLKPELVRGAQSGGAGARELALNWPG